MRRPPARLLATIVIAITLAGPAAAQGWGSIDMSLPMMNSSFAVQSYSLDLAMQAGADRGTAAAPVRARAPASTSAGKAATDRVIAVSPERALVPARLARAYPEDRRRDAETVFRSLLRGHGDLVRRFGVAPDDMAGALAAFVAGGWIAYNNRSLPDADFKALVAQVRDILDRTPALAAATPAQRREAFEEMAILGMMGATTQLALAQNPTTPNADRIAANMRAAGASWLASIAPGNPDRVRIDARGLSIASR